MPDANNERPQGWGWPINSKKAHFFRSGELRSMCLKWLYAGEREDSMHGSPDNCADCKKRRAKLFPEPTVIS